jgi:hypothetical protein
LSSSAFSIGHRGLQALMDLIHGADLTDIVDPQRQNLA